MNRNLWKGGALAAVLIVSVQVIRPQEAGTKSSSYAPVDIHETFAAILNRMTAAKPEIMRRQMTLLEQRYDLSDRPAKGATMSRSKPLQEGVRMKLPSGITWDQLAKLTPEEIKERGLFPAGLPARRAPADAGRYGRVFQCHHRSATHGSGKGRLSCFLAGPIGTVHPNRAKP